MQCDGTSLRYQIVERMEALGVLLSVQDPNRSVINYRLQRGVKAFYMNRKQYNSKQPVRVKLDAFRARPRGTATFLLSIAYWNETLLWEAIRWERHNLALACRLYKKTGETWQEYNRRVASKLALWTGYMNDKCIHVCILERVYSQVYTAKTLRSVRTDRGYFHWEGLKGCSAAKRSTADELVHSKAWTSNYFR